MKNIYLIGFMGVGKTSVGKELACILNRKFVDTDNIIENIEKKTITDIFKEKGEKFFRKLETDVLKNINLHNNLVVSTGGGTPIYSDNIDILKKGKVVLLDVDVEIIKRRLRLSFKRPVFQKLIDVPDGIEELYKKRKRIYKNIANHVIYLSNLHCCDVAKKIAEIIKK